VLKPPLRKRLRRFPASECSIDGKYIGLPLATKTSGVALYPSSWLDWFQLCVIQKQWAWLTLNPNVMDFRNPVVRDGKLGMDDMQGGTFYH